MLDVGVTCDAGEYVYLDNVDVFATDAPTIQLNLDNSFERWSATNNVSGYNACEFMKITSDKARDGTKSLRIGHETLATDIVLKLYVQSVL